VTKPVKGAAKSGVKGFFIGMYQGITGLVVKPITGTLDGASRAAEGVRNSVMRFEDESKEYRVRMPRAFYGQEKYYKDYEQIDADTFVILYDKEGEDSKELGLIEAFHVVPEDEDVNNAVILVLTNEVIFAWSLYEEKTVWSLDLKDIRIVEIKWKGIQIGLMKATKGFKVK